MFALTVISSLLLVHATCMLYDGLSYPSNVVILTAQKATRSRTCLGTLVSKSAILTTSTCVIDCFQVIVQHDYIAELNNKNSIIFVPATNIVHNNQSHHSRGRKYNVAIVKLDEPLNTASFTLRNYFKMPLQGESLKHQIKNKADYIFMIYGTIFSKDYSQYPALGSISPFKLRSPSECRNFIKPSPDDSVHDESMFEFDKRAQYCVFATQQNVVCSEDEGAPVLAFIQRPGSFMPESIFVGIVNSNSRDCHSIKDMTNVPYKARFSNIVPISPITGWINLNM